MNKGHTPHLRPVTLLLTALLLLSLVTPAFAAKHQRETVRVGFFEMDGYHMIDENGNRSGYGYDLLQLASRYMDYNYEYVGYDKGWNDMLQMLHDGEIDMLTSAYLTDDRPDDFAFSKPVGTSSAMLTTNADNTALISGDYDGYDGLRIGMLSGNSLNRDMAEFAELNRFSFTPVYFTLTSALEQALQDGEVDAILTGSMRSHEEERVLETIGSHDFYVMVRKEDTLLLQRINYAIDQLNAVEGDWMTTLTSRYYTHSGTKDLHFTPEEKRIIQDYFAGRKTLTVAVCTDKKPYAYEEDGKARGIMVDYFAKLAAYATIPYEIIVPESREEYIQWIENKAADVFLDGRYQNLSQLENLGMCVSAPYTTMHMAMVTRRDFDGNVNTLAVSGSQGAFGIDDGLAATAQRLMVPDREAAMNAVLSGRADATYVYLYTAQQFVNQDERGLLTYTLLDEPTYDYHLLFTDNVDRQLAGIFTKAIYAMSDGTFEDIASHYTTYKAGDVDFITWAKIHPLPVLLIGFSMALVAFLLYMMISQFVNQDERGLLTYTLLDEPTYDYHLLFTDNVDRQLAGIFTKAIYAMSDGTFEDIASHYTTYKAGDVDFITWAKIHPLPVLLIGFSMALVAFLLYMMISRRKRVKREIQRADQMMALAEQAERANRAKSDFLANMTHDIRTPMNAIVGFADLMTYSMDDPEKLRDYIQKIKFSGRHLLTLIDEALDMSRIEANQLALRPEPVSLREQLQQTATIITVSADEKGQDFAISESGVLHDSVVVDSGRLRQILLNLLSNAVKYTQDGGRIRLDVEELPCDTEGSGLYRFTVTDNGCGMSPKLLSRIFEPFVRGEASVTNKIQGTGLGMPITKTLVEAMGGTIGVESTVGEGSRFTILLTLPFAPEQEAAVAPETVTPPGGLEGRRFLCAEDNELNAEILAATLEMYGAACTICSDGKEIVMAFQDVKEGEYDAILMDIQMPRMNGLEAARAIRRSDNPLGASIPIFAMTANTSPEDVQRSLDVGMNAHLVKPISAEALENAVDTFCRPQEGETE